MSIHHATRAKAEKAGIVLTEAEGDTPAVTALWAERGLSVTLADAKVALAAVLAVRTAALEYPGLTFGQTPDGDFAAAFEGELLAQGDDAEAVLAEAIEAAIEGELAIDAPNPEDEDDDDAPASVVPERYKRLYAEMGHPGTCGDWLATILNDHCQTEKGDFLLEPFEAICEANGVDHGKYNRTTSGWMGRLRMTCRNVMARKVSDAGVLILPMTDEELPVPAEFAAKWKSKPKKAKGKKAKAEVTPAE